MKLAETVTFGGSGLNRAAHVRTPENLKKYHQAQTTRYVPFWRSKPLVERIDENSATLGFLPGDHPILQYAGDGQIFLGLQDDGTAVFATDISRWEPKEVPESLNAFLDPSEQRHESLTNTQAFVELRANMTVLSPRDAELAATGRGLLEWHRTHQYCAMCGSKSEILNAGWERHCDSCGRRHFPRTDPVVIMLIERGNSVLLGRSPGWPERMFSLLAGFVEPGETIEAAVRREVFEESGVQVGEVSYLASQPWPFPASLMIGCLGKATSDEIKIDPNEIEEALWVTKEEMADVFEGIHPAIAPARNGAIASFLLQHWLADRLN